MGLRVDDRRFHGDEHQAFVIGDVAFSVRVNVVVVEVEAGVRVTVDAVGAVGDGGHQIRAGADVETGQPRAVAGQLPQGGLMAQIQLCQAGDAVAVKIDELLVAGQIERGQVGLGHVQQGQFRQSAQAQLV